MFVKLGLIFSVLSFLNVQTGWAQQQGNMKGKKKENYLFKDTRKPIAKGMKLGIWFQGRIINYEQPPAFQTATGKNLPTSGNFTDSYIRRLRFILAGQFFKNWKYVTQIAAGPLGEFETPDKNLRLLDAFVAYTRFKQAHLLVGREKIFFSRPFSDRLPYWKNAILPLAQRTVLLGMAGAYKQLYPDVALKAVGGSNNENALKGLPLKDAYRIAQDPGGRATGAVLEGFLLKGYVNYKAGIYNAWRDGERSIMSSQNPGYLKLLQFQINPWKIENTSLLGYQGNYMGQGKHLSLSITFYQQNHLIEGKGLNSLYDTKYNSNGLALDLAGNYKAFNLSAEYLNVKLTHISILSSTTGYLPEGSYPEMQMKTWWIQSGYMFPFQLGKGKLQLMAMQEHYNPDAQNNYKMNPLNLTHVALNYYLFHQIARVTAEYIFVNNTVTYQNTNQFILQLNMALWK